MPDILNKVGIKSSSLDDVYKALTRLEGLSGWWTTDTQGKAGNVGGVIQFRFGAGGIDMMEREGTQRACRQFARPRGGQAICG